VAASPVKPTLMMPGVGYSQAKARRWMKNPLFVDPDIEADHVDFA